MQHSAGVWNGSHGLIIHLYLISEGAALKDAVVVAYKNSMQRVVQNKHEVLLGDVDPLYMFAEKEGSDDNLFTSTISIEVTRYGDENFRMDLRPHFLIDAPIEEALDRKVRNLSLKCFHCFVLINQLL